MHTAEYAPGRLADLFGAPTEPTVLLWHGQQPDARAVISPLAELVAGHGRYVVVPDWNSHAADGGRADLLRSLQFAQESSGDIDDLVLVGWSLGGTAAAGLTLQARQFNLRLAHTVCLAGAFMASDPFCGRRPDTAVPVGGDRSPFTLIHGTADDVVPVTASRAFVAALTQSRWPVEFVELATDHGGIAGAVYDSSADRYLPAEYPQTLAVAADVAACIASAHPGRRGDG